jgi:DNA-directed RNA polymerase specialized sigma24 family protein
MTATLRTDIANLLPRLRRFARSITVQREAADDLVQVAVGRAQVRSASVQAHHDPVAIRNAMSLLPADHRIVIGLAPQIPIGTLTSRLARARVALQGLLSDLARTVS